MKFHHIALGVFDLDSMVEFYQNLGFRSIKRFRKQDEDTSFAFLEGLGIRLELISGRREEEFSRWDHLSFRVKNLMQVYQDQKNRGLKFLSEPKTGISCKLFVYFVDPEGNKLELYEE